MSRYATLPLLLITFAAFARVAHAAEPAQPSSADVEFFEKRVRPVLVERCYKCHSQKAEKVRGGLLLDSRDGLTKGGSSGPVIVPGDPGASPLVTAVRYTDEDLQMPPKERLPPGEVAALVEWVKRGAPVPAVGPAIDKVALARRRHWAFRPPQDPPVPAVAAATWPRNPIDRFVLARLEAQGVGPSPPADRRTLIRRASYDLTGLPPTPEELTRFLTDGSPAAYERLVDRLMASPHYGERWARHWLDVARYGDTKGIVFAREETRFVHASAYRDWLVGALNADLPYDQLILQQLAADRLATKDRRPLAAMGFLTLGPRFLNNFHDIIDDRIDVVSRGLLGLTVGCARCHDHKYDPIPTEDYYSLYGVFAGSTEAIARVAPASRAGSETLLFERELARRHEHLARTFAEREKHLLTRERAKTPRYLVAVAGRDDGREDADQCVQADDLNDLFVRRWRDYLDGAARADDPIWGPWRMFWDLPAADFMGVAPRVMQAIEARRAKLNPLVAAAFTGAPPASMAAVAQRYGKILIDVDGDANATGAAAQALRQVLHRPDGPVIVPAARNLQEREKFFDENLRVQLGKLGAEIERWIVEAPGAAPHFVILEDRPVQVEPRVFLRGSPSNKGPAVPRRFLAVLSPEKRRPFEDGSGRLELAQAIASADNPLTARVMVNRVWAWHFGVGLVRTPSDFGARGDPPTHPELLDWLARRFVEGGWSLKKLHRLIMLSATYQQSSDDNPAARRVDPTNTLLWHAVRRRLDFEEIRDSALAVSGQLDASVGGRPFSLAQQPSSGRRTMYGFIDRMNLPGMMRTFDFANPHAHSPQRFFTTVPQQALFMMNGALMTEQARHLARRSEVAAEADPERRLGKLYGLVFGRAPTAGEVRVGLDLLRDLAHFEPPSPPPPSAWTYGCAAYDEAGKLQDWRPLRFFDGTAWSANSEVWRAGAERCSVTSRGGIPGVGPGHAVVRRWNVPRSGTVAIKGTLAQQDRWDADGIRGRLVHSREGVLGSWIVRSTESTSGSAEVEIHGLEVKAGDTLDFVVDSRKHPSFGGFDWSPVIKLGGTEWSAEKDFGGPTTADAGGAWGKLAQVLLETNEFVFID